MATLAEILNPEVITEVISRVKTPQTRLQDFYGLGPGQANAFQVGGSHFAYDVFNNQRTLAKGKGFGTGPATAAPIPVGTVSGKFWRSHEQIPLTYDRIFRNRPLGSGFGGEVDVRGTQYIGGQEEKMVSRFKNTREMVIAKCLVDGAIGVLINGSDYELVAETTGDFDIDFQVPTANQGNIGSIFSQDWDTNAATVAANDQLMALNAQSASDSGFPISEAWVNSTTWGKVQKVTQFQTLGGSANTVFSTLERTGLFGADGIGDSGFTAVLRAVPWLTWHVHDDVLSLAGTEAPLIPDDHALFTPSPDSKWLDMGEGSELILERLDATEYEGFGMNGWATPAINPASLSLTMLDIFMPNPKIPNAWYSVTNLTG